MNLYKIVFIGLEQQPDYVIVGSGSMAEEAKKSQKDVPSHLERGIYQIYDWADSSEAVIGHVKTRAKLRGIEIEDFTKVSLVCSDKAVGNFMREAI